MKCRTLAVMGSKGGIGKTSTAISLAHGLARHGRRVLIVDTDTQGQIAESLGIASNDGLVDFVRNGDGAAIVPARDNLNVLSGGRKVALIETEIRGADVTDAAHYLANALEPLHTQYDYIIIDSSPSWSQLAVNIVVASDELLCPTSLEILSVRGLRDFVGRVRPILSNYGGQLSYVLPTALDRRVAQSGEILEHLQDDFGELLCEPIRIDVRLSECVGHGETIFEYSPTGKAAADYQKLIDKVIADE